MAAPYQSPTLRSRRGKSKSFLLFSKLAYELREVIFTFAAEVIDPNIVKIYLNDPEDDPNNSQPEIRASYKIPALLKVNRQARFVAKKIYPLVFSLNLRGKQVFFNVSKDILYFEGNPNWDRGWQILCGCSGDQFPVETYTAPTQTQTQRQVQLQTQKRPSTYPEPGPIHNITPGWPSISL